jgi:hypothetical protein
MLLKYLNEFREQLDVKRGVKEMDDMVQKFIDSSPKTKDIKIISPPKIVIKTPDKGTRH